VTPNGQSEIVVVGGKSETTLGDVARINWVEIFNVDTGVWREGNDFPWHIDLHAQVRYEDTFLITGGRGGTWTPELGWHERVLDTVYRYNVDSDSFSLMATRLPTAIQGHSALVLDRAPQYCDKEEVVKLTNVTFSPWGGRRRRAPMEGHQCEEIV